MLKKLLATLALIGALVASNAATSCAAEPPETAYEHCYAASKQLTIPAPTGFMEDCIKAFKENRRIEARPVEQTAPKAENPNSSIVLPYLLIGLALNMLPFIIACLRRHNAKVAIFVTLVLLDIGQLICFPLVAVFGIGMFLSFILMLVWFGTLIWSFNGNTKSRDLKLARMMADAVANKS